MILPPLNLVLQPLLLQDLGKERGFCCLLLPCLPPLAAVVQFWDRLHAHHMQHLPHCSYTCRRTVSPAFPVSCPTLPSSPAEHATFPRIDSDYCHLHPLYPPAFPTDLLLLPYAALPLTTGGGTDGWTHTLQTAPFLYPQHFRTRLPGRTLHTEHYPSYLPTSWGLPHAVWTCATPHHPSPALWILHMPYLPPVSLPYPNTRHTYYSQFPTTWLQTYHVPSLDLLPHLGQ